MPTAMVTGANSGIANAFAQILVKEVSTVISSQVRAYESARIF